MGEGGLCLRQPCRARGQCVEQELQLLHEHAVAEPRWLACRFGRCCQGFVRRHPGSHLAAGPAISSHSFQHLLRSPDMISAEWQVRQANRASLQDVRLSNCPNPCFYIPCHATFLMHQLHQST